MLQPFLFCLCIFSAGAFYNEIDDLKMHRRILNGRDVDPNSILFQVSIRVKNIHSCGGSIISNRTILTAAHCVHRHDPKILTVVAGTVYLNSGGDIYKVASYQIHEHYDAKKHINDIAMIYLEKKIIPRNNIRIILPHTSVLQYNSPVVLSGWGMQKYPGPFANQLQTIKLKTITNALCSFMFIRYINNGQICTLTQAGEGSCRGDSGSPLVADGEIVGIVSMGYPCAIGIPDIYTRVSYYIMWINRFIKK